MLQSSVSMTNGTVTGILVAGGVIEVSSTADGGAGDSAGGGVCDSAPAGPAVVPTGDGGTSSKIRFIFSV